MAQLIQLTVALLCLILPFSYESSDNDYNEVVQFILDSYNEKLDTRHVYNSATVIKAYKKNGSEPLYLLQLEVALRCNSSVNCEQSLLVCEVGIRENASSNVKDVLTDRFKCAKKEFEPIFPSSGHGFHEENVTNEIRNIAAFAVQQAENSNGGKRSVVDIMSVKRQVIGNATTLYLTLKVTKTEGGDAVQFEACEAEMNQTNEMAWESNLTCFPLNGLAADSPINAEDITAVAERAADEMDSLSFSEFTLKLVDVLKAETSVSPGSEGTVTHLELRLAPTLCLKNVDIENDNYGLYGSRICPENLSNKRLICSVISWDRPWVEDTLYSEPACHEDDSKGRIQQAESSTQTVQHDSPNIMINDQVEPENEEIFLPAVEHHSIPVVEELDPIIEQILPNVEESLTPVVEEPLTPVVEESLTPVVEEPIIVKHTYCTGCPVDLDVSNPALNEFVEQALVAIDSNPNGQFKHKATRIVKAQKQIVNGVKYIIHLEITETTCLKESEQIRSSCDSNDNKYEVCIVEFLEKPWIDSNREIVSNNCTRYKNDLENEIEPHFVSNSHSARQEIFDYLDAMDESDPINGEEHTSYGKDGLYPPGNEPEGHPVESDAEEIHVNSSERDKKKSDKSQLGDGNSEIVNGNVRTPESSEENDDSRESGESQPVPKDGNKQDSDESEEDSSSERKENSSGESRSRRESSPMPRVGGLKEIGDDEKELVDKLAQIAVNTLDEIDEDDKKRVVLEILSAKKQIVNGILYHLQLRVVSTSCQEDGQSEPDCMNKQLSPVKICKVELHRSFASDSQLDSKVVKSECAAETEVAPEKNLRKKRDLDVVTGGLFQADLDDPYITRMADFGVSELDRSTNSLYKQCIVRIIKASKQVVAGYNIYLTVELRESANRKGDNEAPANSTCALSENAVSDTVNKVCDIVIWHQPWIENSQQVTNYNCSDASNTVNELPVNRRKRRAIVGGPISANISDPYIQELANSGLAEVDRSSNALYRQQIVRIIEATKQLVSGVKVRITMELGYTTCRKGSNANSDCQLRENSNNQICYVEIWDRPWLEDRQILNVSCSPAADNESSNRSKRHVRVGGSFPVEADDPYVLETAKIALAQFDRISNALYRQKIVRVIEARKQVVAGTLMKLTLEIGFSKCRKGREADLETCELKENSNNQICYVEVWDRPWLDKREVTKSSCNPVNQNRLKQKSNKKEQQFEEFQAFIDKYNKKYSTSAEYKRRFHIFRGNLKKIELLQRTEQGTAKYGITQFADLSAKEFKKNHLGLNLDLKHDNHIPMKEAVISEVELPTEFDWRHYNVVTEVKNQGSCGSCWAFSVTGNIEGQWAIKKGKLLSLSEQELVDCDSLDDGCNGGLPDNAYRAIEKLGGMETETDYPYDGEDEKCHFNESEVKVTIQGSLNITKNETKIAQWLYKNGPVSIGINANAMQFYTGGISHPWKFLCNGDNLDHGVLIVGFGVHTYPLFHKVLPFWIVKNSWGEFWGEQGYYRVYRGDGTCGVNEMVTSAIVD